MLIAHSQFSLPSTSKYPRNAERHTHHASYPPSGPAPAPAPSPGPDRTGAPIANLHPSLLFRKNTAFLGAVFAGAFAFEVYVSTTVG